MSARSLKKKSEGSSLKASDRESIESKEDKIVTKEEEQAKWKREVDQKKQQYWVAMARRLQRGREFAQRAVSSKQYTLNQQIMEGRYDIKEREWSARDQNLKNSRTKLTTSAVMVKRDLQNQLSGIQSRINEELKEKASKMMSQQQHQNFMKKIQQQRKEQERRRLEVARAEEQQRLQEQARIKQEKEREELERRNKKKQELVQKLRLLEQQRKKQAQLYQQQDQILKQKFTEKTMADKISQQYNFKQNQFLQEKKKRLAQIRDLHKPIDKNQLDSFAQKIDQLHLEKKEARENKEVKSSINKFYRSAFYKRVQEGQKSKIFMDSRHEDQLTKRKQARDKLKRYSQQVREDHKPTIDEKKVEEIKFRGKNMKQRSFSTSHEMDGPRKLGLRYLEYNKINHKLLGPGDDQEESEEDDKKKKVDYLAELREKNKNIHPLTALGLLQRLEKKHMTREQKSKQILDFTSRIEMKAKRREEVEKIGGGVSEELDSLYLQAIEAKLSLLDLDHE